MGHKWLAGLHSVLHLGGGGGEGGRGKGEGGKGEGGRVDKVTIANLS